MKPWRYPAALALLAVSILILPSCTVLRFEQPEEAAKKDAENRQMAVLAAQVTPSEMQKDDLSLEKQLVNDAGAVLARYSAHVPQFMTDGARGTVFEKINQFYSDEFEAFAPDCDQFFELVKKDYGAGWASVADVTVAESSTFSYELLSAPKGVISVVRTYVSVEKDGSSMTYYYGDTFGGDTGWKLKLSDLFGSHTDKAQKKLLEELKSWCENNDVAADTLASQPIETLTEEFAVAEDSLIICLSPYTLSADDAESRKIELPLSSFEQWMKTE